MLSYKKYNFIGEESPMTAAEALKAKRAAKELSLIGYYPEIRVNISPKMGVFTPKKNIRKKVNKKFAFTKITPAYLV